MFGNSFRFLFSKTCLGECKEKTIFLYFEIKNMFGQLKFKKKKKFFGKKRKENSKICFYQDLNSNTISLNKTDSLN